MISKEKLPSHWNINTLDACSERLRTTTDPSDKPDTEYEYYSIPNYDQHEEPKLVKGKEINSRKRELHGGELLLSRLNPRKERVWKVSQSNNPKIASTEFVALDIDNDLVNRDYLDYYLRSELVTSYLKSKVTSSTKSRKRVPYDEVMRLNVPIPPLKEQEKIVENLDTISESIETVQTARDKVRNIHEKLSQSLINNLIPNSAKMVKIGDVTKQSLYGLNETSGENINGYLYLRITDITETATLPNVPKRVDISKETYQKYKLDVGDLVIARSGATAGKSYVRKADDPAMVYASYLIRFRLQKSKVNPNYLELILQSRQYWNWVENTKRKSAQANINAKEIKSFQFPLPSKAKQEEVVDQYTRRKRKLNKVTEASVKTDKLIKCLYKSLLNNTFQGEYANQNTL